MSKIIVIGLSGESIFLTVDHFNKLGETVKASSLYTEIGGKGYNQAAAINKIYDDVHFITFAGNDLYKEKVINSLKNINLKNTVIVKEKENTALATIITDKNGENNVTVYRGVNDVISFDDFKDELDRNISDCEYILIQMEMPLETVESIISYANSKNIKVILNPAPALKLKDKILKDVFLLTPNELEAKIIFGLDEKALISEVIKEAENKNIKNMIITLGSNGALIYQSSKVKSVEAITVKAVDTTGAGDTFNGALTVKLANGSDFYESAKYASVAAGISVTRKGVICALPSKEEIEKVIKNGKI